jgi:cytochrome bd ubiquinol oxidase subunit I
MGSAIDVHRLHFAFTVTYHYLFPQLTMGLALLIVILKTMAMRSGDEHYNRAARFWAKIFGINFAIGVVTGIPMEFQFGTNWAEFSRSAGGVIGQTLAMEGLFSFFLESTFLGLFLYGEKKLGRVGHWFAAFFVFLGSWMSGYLIVTTDAWMQHPTGYRLTELGEIELTSFWGLLLNRWALWQYAHNMIGALQTGCFVMASVGAFYLLTKRNEVFGKLFVRTGVIVGVIAALLQLAPTGDMQGKLVMEYQPATLAAMEGLFETRDGASLAILGQPDVAKRKLENPLEIPKMLSFLTYKKWNANVKGLNAFPEDQWPDKIELLYFSYHIMVGLGTIFIAIMVISAFLLWRERLFHTKWMLWVLMLSVPLPYIANTAGWMTAELGRQPWLIYGVMRTIHGASPRVGAGSAWFSLLGFMGLYVVLSILWLFLVYREIELGPLHDTELRHGVADPVAAD